MSERDAPASSGAFTSARVLDTREIALLELFQRQGAMLTQMWQHFLLANVAVVAMIVLVSIRFSGPSDTPLGTFELKFFISGAIAVIWFAFTCAGLDGILKTQDVLLKIGRQIEGEIGDKVIPRASRSKFQIKWFHVVVDIGIFFLCLLLVASK